MPVTNYIWDVVSDNVLMEKDDDDETIARYVQEPSLYGEAISQERDGETRYYNYDGEGNTSELTDEDQNVTDTFEYSAFGEEVARTGSTENPFGYKGALGYYANSETNDIYVRARTYEPKIGRWFSVDPLYSSGNKFLYVENNVATLVDPSGLVATMGGLETIAALESRSCGPCASFNVDFKIAISRAKLGLEVGDTTKFHLVQYVCSFRTIYTCADACPRHLKRECIPDGGVERTNCCFYEWLTDKGAITYRDEIRDRWTNSGVVKRCVGLGHSIDGAIVKLFPANLVESWGMWKKPGFFTSGACGFDTAPWSQSKPAFWNAAVASAFNGVRYLWDCCPYDPDETRAVMYIHDGYLGTYRQDCS